MVYALRLRYQCGQRRRRFVCAASALIETADISDLRYPIWPRARRKATALAGAKHTSLQFPLQALMLPTVTAAGIPACIGAVPRAGHHSNASGVSAWLESKLRRCPRVAAPSPRGSTWPGHRGRRARRASAAHRQCARRIRCGYRRGPGRPRGDDRLSAAGRSAIGQRTANFTEAIDNVAGILTGAGWSIVEVKQSAVIGIDQAAVAAAFQLIVVARKQAG